MNFWSDESDLKFDCGDGCPTPQIYFRILYNIHLKWVIINYTSIELFKNKCEN